MRSGVALFVQCTGLTADPRQTTRGLRESAEEFALRQLHGVESGVSPLPRALLQLWPTASVPALCHTPDHVVIPTGGSGLVAGRVRVLTIAGVPACLLSRRIYSGGRLICIFWVCGT